MFSRRKKNDHIVNPGEGRTLIHGETARERRNIFRRLSLPRPAQARGRKR